jgi:hypothetical protein
MERWLHALLGNNNIELKLQNPVFPTSLLFFVCFLRFLFHKICYYTVAMAIVALKEGSGKVVAGRYK